MADLAVEELRKRRAWEFTDRVLDLFSRESHNNPITRRPILRFALCSPAGRAMDFVQRQRRDDPGTINDLEAGLAEERRGR